ncbi:MAG: hypothetical protein R2747_09820 [Pyrinomonadaceae bacterium]
MGNKSRTKAVLRNGKAIIGDSKIRFFFLCLTTAGLVLSFAGQLALGQKVTGKNDPGDFISEDGGFKVSFPQTPERSVSDIGVGFLLTTYETMKEGRIYMITYFDLKNPGNANSLYDAARDRLLIDPERTLTEEKVCYLGNFPGRELVIEEGLSTSIQRLFLINDRFFQLVVFLPLRVSETAPKLRDLARKPARGFLDSFQIKAPPGTQKDLAQFPADLGLKPEKRILSSSFFGFSIKPQSQPSLLSDEEKRSLTDEPFSGSMPAGRSPQTPDYFPKFLTGWKTANSEFI